MSDVGVDAAERAGDADIVATAASPIGLDTAVAALSSGSLADAPRWRPVLRPYERSDARGAVQLVSVLVMFGAGWVLALRLLDVHYALSLVGSTLIAVAVIRCFIIFHDCGHGSFFKSRAANDIVGFASGVLTFTPYYHWRGDHALHHRTSGHLDRRGIGDVWTMTVEEYRAASPSRRRYYRAYHSTWVMFTVGPVIKFAVLQRMVALPDTTPRRITRSVHVTNAGIVVFVGLMVVLVGPLRYLAVQVPALVIGGSGAIWLFYVQHCFDGAYWARRDRWRYVDAAIRGSSHLRLGRVLQYVSGNIGFHHLHHLDARIPNYNLPRCARSTPSCRRSTASRCARASPPATSSCGTSSAARYVGYEAVGR